MLRAVLASLVLVAVILTNPSLGMAATSTCLASGTVTNGSTMSCDVVTTGTDGAAVIFYSSGSGTTSEFGSCVVTPYLPDGTTLASNLAASAYQTNSGTQGSNSAMNFTISSFGFAKLRFRCTNASGSSKTIAGYSYTEDKLGTTGNSSKVQITGTDSHVIVDSVGAVVPVKGSPNGGDAAVKVDASGAAVPVTDNGGTLSVDDGAGSLTVDCPTDCSGGGSGGTVTVDGPVALDAATIQRFDLETSAIWFLVGSVVGLYIVLTIVRPLFRARRGG